MRNLFKKSLTLCLVAILAFSCFAGIVSAENPFTATIAVDNQTITPGTTSVDVVLDITSPQIGINEALIEVSSDIGTIDVQANLGEYTTANNEKASIVYPGDSTNYGSFYLSVADDLTTDPSTMGSLSAATITVTFTVDENKAVGTYPINIAVDGVRAASGDEDVITFTYATANVTIAEPHVHKYTYTPNEGDKTHNGTCTCGEDAIYNEACVDGDDEDTLCDKCNFDLAEEEVCVHENATKEVTQQPTKDAVGVMTYTCECGHSWTEDIAIPAAITTVNFANELVIEEKTALRLRFSKTTLNNKGYDDFYIAMEYEMYDTVDGWKKKTQTDTITFADDFALMPESTTIYYHIFAYQAIYELGLPLKATVYFMTDGIVTAYREILNTTLKDKFLAEIPNYPEKNLKMSIDLINYAAAVQTNFSGNGDVATAEAIDKGFESYQYAASTQTEFTYSNPNYTRDTVADVTIAPDYTIGAANNIRFRTRVNPATYDMSKVRMVISYENGFYKEIVKTPELDITSFEVVGGTEANPVYAYFFTQLALYDFNKTVTATIYYDGEQLYQAQFCLEYDVHKFLVTDGGTGPETTKNVYITAMRLAESSRAAFNLNEN